MNAGEEGDPVLAELAARGVQLWLCGGHVRWSGPGGGMTVALLRRLKEGEPRLRDQLAAAQWAAMERGQPPSAPAVERLAGYANVGLLGLWRENEAFIAASLRRGDQAALAYWRHRRAQVLEPELTRRGMRAPAGPRRPPRGRR